ncbi:hypothetical protein K469DRAFT_340481 [Zopfia rhizophila CBS 207.26]|uniref:Uncharacterized protein n=1 Tax=Zopfia rhizophila CBS 207.26 TaxID=1314779 RepID=A0A6A6EK00_9PEZI|nr:hypothetical protein K469DRAFT_340481 [Zopfia rhizophila CBS 207.26]
MKVFIASRPVGQLDIRRSQFHNFIRLLDETKPDIFSFVSSFLNRLNLPRLLAQAKEYIVKIAQGVFLWAELVGKELLDCEEQGYSKKDILKFLKELPTELVDFYTLMLERMTTDKSNLTNTDKLSIRDRVKCSDSSSSEWTNYVMLLLFRIILAPHSPFRIMPSKKILFHPNDVSFIAEAPSQKSSIIMGVRSFKLRIKQFANFSSIPM